MSEEKENLYPEVKDHTIPDFNNLFRTIGECIFHKDLSNKYDLKNKNHITFEKKFWVPPVVLEYMEWDQEQHQTGALLNTKISLNKDKDIFLELYPNLRNLFSLKYLSNSKNYLLNNPIFLIKPILSDSCFKDYNIYFGMLKAVRFFTVDSERVDYNVVPPEVSIGITQSILRYAKK